MQLTTGWIQVYKIIKECIMSEDKISLTVFLSIMGIAIFLLIIQATDWNFILNTTYPRKHTIYFDYSAHSYPIYKSFSINGENFIYFDNYKEERIDGENIITVSGFIYPNGWVWSKCDGDFKFKKPAVFLPQKNIENEKIEVIDMPCVNQGK
jgi:hypothetical protein